MPAKKIVSKETIINKAFELLRKDGSSALNARNIAKALNCSTQPIYLSFKNMGQLKESVDQRAKDTYNSFLENELKSGKYPPYKAYGMGYVRFAKEERELFKYVFMRDRTDDPNINDESEIKNVIEVICKQTGYSYDEARMFHLEQWTFVHGIATMIATLYLDWDMNTVSAMISNAYNGLRHVYDERRKTDASHKNDQSDKKI